MLTPDQDRTAEDQFQPIARRIERLALHLSPGRGMALLSGDGEQLRMVECSRGVPRLSVETAALSKYMRGKHRDIQQRVFEYFSARPELQTPIEISKDDHRELCMRQLHGLVRETGIRPFRYLLEDPAKYFAFLEAVGSVDMSLGIKTGVQYSLWGGSVINLGTKKHKDKYFDGIDNLEYPGCFAMTELHHGSNVQGLQTTATFDPITDEFIINTPNDGAIKWWIGNAAVHGKLATVFAKLMLPTHNVKGVSDMGVHAFIVPIRDLKTNETLPGIEIHDCGHKVGLNGVDNGALRFRSVRIPRENLLNRFGDVSRDGKYTSSLPTINKRFAATLGELVGGRVGLAYSSVSVLKLAGTIAIRYSLLRQQFGPPKQAEVSILDYQSHQHKLMPMLASTYAFHFATVYLVDKYSEMKKTHDEQLVADVHALSAGLKAYVTSYTAKSLSICREACGGHGYAAVNRFGILRNDHDIFQTFEGDNTVLLQQVAGDLLKQYKEKFQGGTFTVTWNYLKESMNTYLSQPNPVTARWESEDHLRDPKFQLDAFRYRTSRLLQSVAVRLRKHSKNLGSFGAWNRCLNHLLTLAESHIESVILAKFIDAVQRNISSTIPSELRCERNTMPVYNGFYEVEPDDHRDLSCNSTRIDVPILQKYNSDLRHNISAAKEILKKGFDLRYNDVYAGRDCMECIDSAGKCGYRRTSHEFVCFSRPGDNNFRLKLGLSIGLSLPVICLLIFLFLWRRKQKRSAQRLSRNISDPYMNSDPEGGSVCYGVHVFSYKDLDEATNNFDSKKELGDGGFGTVYHGKLKDGRDIAVKRLYEHNYKRVEQFKNEVEILTRLRHKNLVSLYGCTSRRCRELLLVYEYIPNGTVADHLHGDRAQTSPLTWPVRISIAIETATALAYLHASEIVHRDVKTNNILLDDNFCVKVADFGLSRLFPNDVTHVSTAPQGTPGYVDPEYHQCYQLTSKSDVYSFGVVLVELISSMPAVDITRHRLEINLSNLAISKIQKGAYNELVDLRLGFDSNNEVKRMTIAVAELAFQCLQQDKEMRPSMDEVLDELKRIENGNNESENHEKGFDGVTTSEQPPPSPECHEVGLLKRMNEQPPSPNTVIENWPSSWSSSTPNISG